MIIEIQSDFPVYRNFNRIFGFFWKLDKSDFEDFTSPEENYSKYKNLKNDLVQVQKRLSKMDIVEWHEITGSLHPANHVMDKVRVNFRSILPKLRTVMRKLPTL